MSSILTEIAKQRRIDVDIAKKECGEEELRDRIRKMDKEHGPPLSILSRLHQEKEFMAVAAEFKRASPSKGDICIDKELESQIEAYVEGGAAVLSVLTESTHFKGTLDDMLTARRLLKGKDNRPAVLRKDFILDEYQLLEARAFGADSVLLIVALLDLEALTQLIKTSRALKMEPLVEVNGEEELEIALQAQAKLIGVNNRNLHTFQLDLGTTTRVTSAIKAKGLVVGEFGITVLALSGISSYQDVVKFQDQSVTGVLVGESLMRSCNPAASIQILRGKTNSSRYNKTPLVKICGITNPQDALIAARAGANVIGMIFVPGTPRFVEIEKAKEIAACIHQFGERSGPIELRSQVKMSKHFNTSTWFETWANHVYHVSQRTPLVTGVFMDQTPEEINTIVHQIGLDLVQLHGDEGFEICKAIDVPVCRVLHLPHEASVETVDVESVVDHVKPGLAALLLLDTTVKGKKGGTGAVFDWKIAQLFHNAHLPCIMAGGLTPENVSKALHTAAPFGVDVSSGVEKDGQKDPEAVKTFVRLAKTPRTCSIQE